MDLTHIAPNTKDFITAGESALNVAKAYLATTPPVISREDIELRAPITKMDKVGCDRRFKLTLMSTIPRFYVSV